MRRPRSALGLGLALALGLGGSASAAEAPPRPLSLADAVELAMRVDPVLAESQVQKDRSKLGVLRAQLERVSLKIDGTLQELWNIQNVGGPTIPPYCTLGLPDQSTCTLAGGTWVANPDQNPSSGQGLFNLQANLVAPIFTGFRITADVKRAQMAGYYPQLSAFGSFQYGNNPFQFSTGASVASSAANPFTGLAGNLTLGAVLRMNFFDTLSTWSSVKDAKFEESRLAEEKKRADRIVESDVRSAHARVEHLTGRRAPLLAALDVARDNATLLEKRYQNGDALVIEYLDAQIDLAQVELTLVDVSAQLELAWLELDAALGRTVGAR